MIRPASSIRTTGLTRERSIQRRLNISPAAVPYHGTRSLNERRPCRSLVRTRVRCHDSRHDARSEPGAPIIVGASWSLRVMARVGRHAMDVRWGFIGAGNVTQTKASPLGAFTQE